MFNRERIRLRDLLRTQVPFFVLVAHVVNPATVCMTLGIMGTMITRADLSSMSLEGLEMPRSWTDRAL